MQIGFFYNGFLFPADFKLYEILHKFEDKQERTKKKLQRVMQRGE